MGEELLKKAKKIQTVNQFKEFYSYILKKRTLITEELLLILEDILCELNNWDLINNFITDFKLTNVERFTNMICNSMDPEKIYQYSIKTNNANINALSNVISNTGSAMYIYYFALSHQKRVNIEKLNDAISKTNSGRYLFMFLKEIKGINSEKIVNRLIELQECEYLIKISKEIKNINIDSITDVICNSKKVIYIYKMLTEVKQANKDKLKIALLQTKDFRYIILYLVIVKDIALINDIFGNINELRKYILLCPEYFEKTEYQDILNKIDRICISETKELFNNSIDNYLLKNSVRKR